jgi:diadenosine tetraphosphatase ApaH/serine/threonine PP2A family protein phosphatase
MEPCDIVLTAYSDLLHQTAVGAECKAPIPCLPLQVLFDLLSRTADLLRGRNALIEVTGPTVIIGDLHGSINDLLRVLQLFPSYPKSISLLFLGDYVDRGLHSVPVMTLLLALLCKYPTQVFLLRGNHEFANVNRDYGFYDEIMSLYHCEDLWGGFQVVFSYLPLAAVVDSKLFCVHGGLSPGLVSLAQIASIELPITDYIGNALVSDLLWSDPHNLVPSYAPNHRGMGVLFGPSAVRTFLGATGLRAIVRAHQCVADGYLMFAQNCGITIFTSSSYCGVEKNRAAVIHLTADGRLDLVAIPVDPRVSIPRVAMKFEKAAGLRRTIPHNTVRRQTAVTIRKQGQRTGSAKLVSTVRYRE